MNRATLCDLWSGWRGRGGVGWRGARASNAGEHKTQREVAATNAARNVLNCRSFQDVRMSKTGRTPPRWGHRPTRLLSANHRELPILCGRRRWREREAPITRHVVARQRGLSSSYPSCRRQRPSDASRARNPSLHPSSRPASAPVGACGIALWEYLDGSPGRRPPRQVVTAARRDVVCATRARGSPPSRRVIGA